MVTAWLASTETEADMKHYIKTQLSKQQAMFGLDCSRI